MMPDYIKITHQPKTMATPTIRAALTSDDIPHVPLSEDDLRRGWNRHAAALKAEPRRQGPTDEDIYDLAAEFNGDPVPAMRRALELWGNPLQGAPAPGENLAAVSREADMDHVEQLAAIIRRVDGNNSMGAAALAEAILGQYPCAFLVDPLDTPPAPEPQTPPTDDALWHELINEIARVQHVAAGEGQGGRFDLAKAVELWRRTAAPPEPETPAEALAVRPLLERVAQLGDVIGRQTVAQVQQLANQAAAWLRENPPGQPVAIDPRDCPTPGACSCVEPTPPAPVPVAWCRSDEFANSMNRGCSFNGWKDPGAGANKCDMQLYAIPCPAPVPVAELDDQRREAVHQAVAEALGSGAYDCTRVWSAWSYGTMGPDDFVPMAEDSDRVAEIADAAIEAIRAIPLPAPEPVGECPHCGYEGEMAPAPQAGDVEA